MFSRTCILKIIFVINFLCIVIESRKVPVIIWTPSSTSSLPEAHSLQRISANTFADVYLPKISENNSLVVFLQDSLSVEDITMYANVYGFKKEETVFPYLSEALSSSQSALLPQVQNPETGILNLKLKKNALVLKDGQYSLPTTGELPSLIIVYLPSTVEITDRRLALRKNDEIMHNVLSSMQQQNYIAMYTAHRSSWADSMGEVEPGYMSRQLLALPVSEPYKGFFFNQNTTDNCFLLYANSMMFRFIDKNEEGIVVQNINETIMSGNTTSKPDYTVDCKVNNTVAFTLTASGTAYQNLTFKMNFELKKDNNWYMTFSEIAFVLKDGFQSVTDLSNSDVWAPQFFSYHCKNGHMEPNYTYVKNNKYGEILFDNLQLQVGNLTAGPDGFVFGDWWDCVGFFSIGVWCAILVTLILITILGFGVSALAAINTMDRFDDPKGKPLTVNIIE